jgi:hypothetical protein
MAAGLQQLQERRHRGIFWHTPIGKIETSVLEDYQKKKTIINHIFLLHLNHAKSHQAFCPNSLAPSLEKEDKTIPVQNNTTSLEDGSKPPLT